MYYLQEKKMYKITQDNNLNLQFPILNEKVRSGQ